MKFQKTITVDICPTCRAELTYFGAGRAKPCARCGVELCETCAGIFEAHVEHHKVLWREYFCRNCGKDVQRALEEIGLKLEPSKRVGAVYD